MGYSFEEFKGAVVVITGSGRGIGKGIAELFVEMGSKVVVTDIDADVVKSTSDELSGKGGEVLGVVCDVTNEEQVENLMKETIDKWGQIDHLVNNAGITKDGLFLRMKLDQFQIVNKINVDGTFNMIFAVKDDVYHPLEIGAAVKVSFAGAGPVLIPGG